MLGYTHVSFRAGAWVIASTPNLHQGGILIGNSSKLCAFVIRPQIATRTDRKAVCGSQ